MRGAVEVVFLLNPMFSSVQFLSICEGSVEFSESNQKAAKSIC
jgi:hypothetical protein